MELDDNVSSVKWVYHGVFFYYWKVVRKEGAPSAHLYLHYCTECQRTVRLIVVRLGISRWRVCNAYDCCTVRSLRFLRKIWVWLTVVDSVVFWSKSTGKCFSLFVFASFLLCHLSCFFPGMKPYTCNWPNCDYQCNANFFLENHTRTHTGIAFQIQPIGSTCTMVYLHLWGARIPTINETRLWRARLVC